MAQARQLLLTPGPTDVPEPVLEALRRPMIHHRTKDYQAIFGKVNAGLKELFRTREPVVTFASSGTGAMEASVVNLLSRGDKVIACHAGKFGERYRDLARVYGCEVVEIRRPYGKAVRPGEVREALQGHPDAKAVLMTFLETSTGVVHPVEDIAGITRRSGAVLMVDAVSGMACDPLEMDAWGVDVVVCGSQKGLMLPPGLAFLAVNERARELAERSDLPKYYFHLGAALKALAKEDTPYTPAVNLVYGLEASLGLILGEGLPKVWERHAKIASKVRGEIKGLGLSLFPENPSNALTAISMPEGVVSDALIKSMRSEENIVMANGQAQLKGKMVRFAHMGDTAREEPARRGLNALTRALAGVGYVPVNGKR